MKNIKGFGAITIAIAIAFITLLSAVFIVMNSNMAKNSALSEASDIYQLQTNAVKLRFLMDEALAYVIKDSVDASSCQFNRGRFARNLNSKFNQIVNKANFGCNYDELRYNIDRGVMSVSLKIICSKKSLNLDVNYSTDVSFKKKFELDQTNNNCNIKVCDEQANHLLELDTTV